MVAGGDYYTKVAGVTTSTGESDSYQVTGTGIVIDFDNQKTGNYSLLTDNFQDTLTGTVFLSGIVATPAPQKLSYDWQKVAKNSSDAILYQIDSNGDGVYDISSNFSAIPISPQEKGSISGYVIGDTNASMAGWKVCIDKNKNNTCEENRETFAITDNTGYYKFMNLGIGSYSVLLISHKNWTTLKPQNNIYNITLSSGQNIINLNFENTFLKGKNK